MKGSVPRFREAVLVPFSLDLERAGGRRSLARELSVWTIALYRTGRWADGRPGLLGALLQRAYWPLHRVAVSLTGLELPKDVEVGPGLRVHHAGSVVIHPDTRIGSRCTLRQGVTLGERRPGGGAPVLGDGVDVGAYAQVLGAVRLGDGARIGALALVLDDVPDGGAVAAPKARPLEPRGQPEERPSS